MNHMRFPEEPAAVRAALRGRHSAKSFAAIVAATFVVTAPTCIKAQAVAKGTCVPEAIQQDGFAWFLLTCAITTFVVVLSACLAVQAARNFNSVGRGSVAPKAPPIASKRRNCTRTVACQSPVTYLWMNAAPRFKPLGAADHGSWNG